MNTRFVKTEFGFEIQRRTIENDPKSTFKQYGAGVAVTIEEHLGRPLTPVEQASLNTNGFVEV